MQLDYPFDVEYILSKRKRLRRELIEGTAIFLEKRIAVLGGSTTHDIVEILELFLLHSGIKPTFYQSEYAQFWQDAMFPNPALKSFAPDIIFIHTSNRNITAYPTLLDDEMAVNVLLDTEFNRFSVMWDELHDTYGCPIIQNNFEYPFYRLLGNRDAWDFRGKVNYVTCLNAKFYEYAQKHDSFFINDINWLAADYGLEKWADPFYWHMYKYALNLSAIPYLAHSVASIISSVFGKNKKVLALDLDNTLWGGIVGDDGAENLKIGQETSEGQVYSEFQAYLKAHKQLGILLSVNSKNDYSNALAGLNLSDCVLKPEDFVVIKANWEPKSQNLMDIADELALLPESFVFVDDNPAEREIIRSQVSGVATPEMDRPERFIYTLDRSHFFEATNISEDDLKRVEMYTANVGRAKLQSSFVYYNEYLLSLSMEAEIKPFDSFHASRIAQLTNKSNQFNLTTKRYTQGEIEATAVDPERITLYGKLTDKFGDNGVVSVVIGRNIENTLHMELWLMSCRVLKREFEQAMLDEVVRLAVARGLDEIRGYYYPTAKNSMVKDFYGCMGFEKLSEDETGISKWRLLTSGYESKCSVIRVNGG